MGRRRRSPPGGRQRLRLRGDQRPRRPRGRRTRARGRAAVHGGRRRPPGRGAVGRRRRAGAPLGTAPPAARRRRHARRRRRRDPAVRRHGRRPADLLARLDDERAVLAGSDLGALGPPGPVRLAIADPTPKRLELARKVVDRGQAWRGRNDVWFAPEGLVAAGGKIAFAFPRHRARRSTPGSTTWPTTSRSAPSWCRARPTSSGRAPTSCTWGASSPRRSRRLRVRPDVVVGHSLGEWTAMLVAEAVTREAIDRFVHGIADGDLVLPDLRVPGGRLRGRRGRGRHRRPARHRGLPRQLPAPGHRVRLGGVGRRSPRSG